MKITKYKLIKTTKDILIEEITVPFPFQKDIPTYYRLEGSSRYKWTNDSFTALPEDWQTMLEDLYQDYKKDQPVVRIRPFKTRSQRLR